MFQYATGRSISLARGQPFCLDISDFHKYGLHQGFEIQRLFSCPVDIALKPDLRRVLGWQSSTLVRRVLGRPGMRWLHRKGLVTEPYPRYWSGIDDVPNDCYLSGYWQSEKYFKDVAEIIRTDFSFSIPPNQLNTIVADNISNCNAVSVHVRRGDYVSDAKTYANHGVCSIDYYRSAINLIAVHINAPEFFIFSDDMEWAKSHLRMDFPCHYIDHNRGSDSFNDMRLMSLCQHHIIANSSFSWWAAWLNSNSDKIVIAPNKWFAHAATPTDLLPQSWISL